MQDINRSHWEALTQAGRGFVHSSSLLLAGGWWMQEWVGEKILIQRHPLASSGVWKKRTGSTMTLKLSSMGR